MLVVASDERSAAGGVTNIVRSIGMSAAPPIVGWLSSNAVGSIWYNSPWVIAGALKCVYDVSLYTLYKCTPDMTHAEATSAKLDKQEARAVAPQLTGVSSHSGGVNTSLGDMSTPLLGDQDVDGT